MWQPIMPINRNQENMNDLIVVERPAEWEKLKDTCAR